MARKVKIGRCFVRWLDGGALGAQAPAGRDGPRHRPPLSHRPLLRWSTRRLGSSALNRSNRVSQMGATTRDRHVSTQTTTKRSYPILSQLS